MTKLTLAQRSTPTLAQRSHDIWDIKTQYQIGCSINETTTTRLSEFEKAIATKYYI